MIRRTIKVDNQPTPICKYILQPHNPDTTKAAKRACKTNPEKEIQAIGATTSGNQ